MRPIGAPHRVRAKDRPVITFLVIAFGTFFLVSALLCRFTVPGRLARFPLNEYEIMTLRGTNISYFSPAKLTELSGVTMQATYTIKGAVTPSRKASVHNVAVWQSFIAIEDLTNHLPFQYTYEQLAMDRSTGRLVNCCGNVIGSNHDLHVAGQGYVWPFGTQRHSYQVFDTTMRKPVTVRYAGTATTAGITTYRFIETVHGRQIGTQTLPGSLIGSSAKSVTLPEFYTTTSTFWVDPVTGNPLKISQNQTLTLRDSGGTTRLVLLHGTLTTTPASVRMVAAPDRSNLRKATMIKDIIPATAGILALVLLGAGLLLSRRGSAPGTGRHEQITGRHEQITPTPAGSER